MGVRSLDLLDLPFLRRYHRNVLPLDHARFLTGGNPLGPGALLSYLNPRGNIYTAVSSEDGNSLMGQVLLKEDETSAHLTFLAPLENSDGLTDPLIDHLIVQAGEWGAFHLLAEVAEDVPLLVSLRKVGFSIYAWQRIWKLPELKGSGNASPWREVGELDWPAIQSLQGQIVPGLIQPVEALPRQAQGRICRSAGELQAYVRVLHGPAGIWLQPLVPPDSSCLSDSLLQLAGELESRKPLPIYVCVRSYQAWLEPALEELGAEAGPRQAVMVHRLAKAIKEFQGVAVVDNTLAKVKPAAPVSRLVADRDPASKK
jgi:hypothetical protein